MTRMWYRFENSADPTVAEITVFDLIGDWIDDWIGWGGVTTAKTFGEALAGLSDTVQTIRVRINSPGGDVFSAITIANLLRDQQKTKGRRVETIVDGLAASAASIVAMGGGTVTMADNALMMIHNPWTVAVGNAAEMRKAAGELDTVRNAIIATYRWHSALGEDDIAGMMDAETWMDAAEAVSLGFATGTVEGLKAAAMIDPRAAKTLKIPEQYRDRVQAFLAAPRAREERRPAAATDVLRLCREGECLDVAESLVTSGATLAEVQARVSEERARRQAAAERETAIRSLCQAAKLPALADGYIRGGMAVEDVRAHLTIVTAAADRTEIDGSLPPDRGAPTRAKLDTVAIYAARNTVTVTTR